MSTCFVILGTPRSGTSLVAGLLHLSGIPMGERLPDEGGQPRWDFPDANEWNPRGFFQDAGVENLLDGWFGEKFLAETLAPDQIRTAEMRRVLSVRSAAASGGAWGVKASRTASVLGDFLAACPDEVRVVETSRPIGRSIASWAKRSSHPQEKASLIVRNTDAAVKAALASHHHLPRMVVDFDALIEGVSEVDRLSVFIGRDLTAVATKLIDPSLRRF